MKAILFAAALALAPASALAQAAPEPAERPFDRACMDDYGRDLCDDAMRAKIRQKFDAEPAEALAARGVEGVRVFMVNGYSQDMPMVSVLWPGGGAKPIIETRVQGEDDPAVLSTPASPWTAESARTLMRLARASPVRQEEEPATNADEEIVICLHAWVTITEVIERRRVHRRIRNACGGDPVFDGGFQLSTQALGAYDRCGDLDASLYRNDSDRLGACAAIKGPDAYAAVQIHNRLSGEAFVRPGSASLDDLAAMMGPDLVVQWPGEPPVRGPAAVASAWEARVAGPARARLWIRSAAGSTRMVKVTGLLIEERGEDEVARAEFTQTWTQDAKFAWRLTEWTIQPFAAVAP